jgi:predicted ATPase/DNA-binding SARP family transcriptional activator
VDFRVLGPVGIVDNERQLPVGGTMPRKLLAVLLANRNEVVSADRLIDALWGDEPPPSAAATLQSYVSRMRRFTELDDRTAIANRAPGYVLEVPEELVDAGRFQHDLARGQALLDTNPYEAVARLDAALGEWRGAAFAEFADEEWARAEAIRLDELRLVATEAAIDGALRVGRHREVVGQLEALVVANPLRERLHAQLMVALYRSGRQAEALRAASELRRVLRDDLGLDPSAELTELEQAILEEREDLRWSPPNAEGAADGVLSRDPRRRGALPTETTVLVGRDADVDLAARLLDSGRILTLFGPGGVGKTRLAQRLAATVDDQFADGVRLVELAPVRDQRAVTAALADVLDLQRRPGRSLEDSIVELLGSQQLLLVLDNCEHVLDVTSELVELVLRWCPEVKVLATSREPLGIPAEVVWSVPPLPVPGKNEQSVERLAAVPAVQLFVERAQAARPEFVLDESTREAVAEICVRLDGVPLALELAAARMRSMSAPQLAARLPEGFRVLAGSRRATDPRHRTLRDLVKWSYDLLDENEQRLFARLSTFVGVFDLERAERVGAHDGIDAADVAPVLGALVDKSMLVADTDQSRTRYRLLETLRQFGREQLHEADIAALSETHLRVHVDLAETAGAGLLGHDEAYWVRELDAAFDDMRAAHVTAVTTGDVDQALRLVTALREYSFRRIRYELLTWTDAALTMPGAEEHGLYPLALGIVAYGRFVRGELVETLDAARRAIAAASWLGTSTLGLAERAIGNALSFLGKEHEALMWMDRMVDAAEAAAIPGYVAHAYYMRSVGDTSAGDAVGGAALAERSAAAAAECGSPTAHAQAAFARGIAVEKTDPVRALELLDRSVQQAQSVGNRWITAFALTESLWIRAQHGDGLDALAPYRDVIDTWFRGGDWANQWLSLRHVFAIFVALERDEAAATLYGALDAAAVMHALPLEPTNADEFDHAVERLMSRYGTAFDDAVERGRAMRDEEVVRHALAEIETVRAFS